MHQTHPPLVRPQSLPRNFECLRIAIHPHQTPRRQPLGDRKCVPACANGGIQIRALRPNLQPVHNFLQQDRYMQNAQKLDAQIFQYLFVFRRDGITIQLFEESRVVPYFQISELALNVDLALHLRRFPQYRWN